MEGKEGNESERSRKNFGRAKKTKPRGFASR